MGEGLAGQWLVGLMGLAVALAVIDLGVSFLTRAASTTDPDGPA